MGSEQDARLLWLEERLVATLRGVKPERFRRLLTTDAGRHIHDFVRKEETRRLFFVDSPMAKDLLVSEVPPVGKALAGARKFMYFIKSRPEALTPDNMDRVVACGDVGGPPLEHLYKMCQDVFLPILSNPANQEGWPEVISREVMEHFHRLIANIYVTIGQSQGRTLLPLPPLDVLALGGPEHSAVRDKERVHVLETAVVTWTRQIRNVLKTEPEQALQDGEHPGPLAEVEFWQQKAANLSSVSEQLDGDKVKKVVRVLELTKSTYFPAFTRLAKEVAVACAEASDNAKYMTALEPLLSRMHGTEDFRELSGHFWPIFHVLMLVWKHSKHYNTSARLVVLVRELCNELIDQARRFISLREIFAIDASDAAERFVVALGVCEQLRAAYLEYKGRVASEVASNPWRVQATALFPRLDAFVERLRDLLDMFRTVVQFAKLEHIEIGGNKGRTLSTSVYQIYADFTRTLEVFRSGAYDVLDVEAKQFDDEYFAFRLSIKELERRLGSVLSQGFDDCVTVFGAFKLIDSFEGLLEREFIQADLERKHLELIKAYGKDLREVSEIFNRQKDRSAEGRYLERDGPPLYANMPPVSGALYWARGLIERIEEPMGKLRQTMRLVLESGEAKDVNKQYTAVLTALRDFEAEQYDAWARSIDVVAYEKLKQPLLSRLHDGGGTLTVNFDPALVCLLREVSYLVRLGFPIPRAADELHKSSETFRIQIGNLQMITARYNGMLRTMLDVEEPLLAGSLKQIDKVLEKGLHHLTWRSHQINDFIREVVVLVREASDTLATLKANLASVGEILRGWEEGPLLRRKFAKTYSPDEFGEEHEAQLKQRYAEIAEGGREVHRLLMASNRVLRVSKGAPMWRAYVEFMNEIVIDGLSRSVANSLRTLCTQVDAEEIARSELLPLLEVQLELSGSQVAFSPLLAPTPAAGAAGAAASIGARVDGWVRSFFHVCKLVKRLDRAEGDFLKEVEENEDVRYYTHQIRRHIVANVSECERFCAPFSAHRELWTHDIGAQLRAFLARGAAGAADAEGGGAHAARGGGGAESGAGGAAGAAAAAAAAESDPNSALSALLKEPSAVVRAKLPTVARARREPSLDDFDEQVAHYKGVQDEVMALPGSANIGWLRVDAKPVKQSLSTWVTKWMFAYTHHLQSRVVSSVEELHAFMKEVNGGLREPPEAGDVNALVRAMTHVRDVRVCTEEIDAMFEPLKATVAVLRRYGIALPDAVAEQLESAPFVWEDTKKHTFNAREELGPAQSLQAEKIREDADVFAGRLREFRAGFARDAPFEWPSAASEVGVSAAGVDALEAAYGALDALHVEITRIEGEAAALSEQEELFDLAGHSWRDIATCRHELRALKLVWDHVSLVGHAFVSWRGTPWASVDVEQMLRECKGLERELRALPKPTRQWGVYAGLWALLQEMIVALPLVLDLRDEAMRERHWKKLMRVCGRVFAMDARTTLDDLLRLQLHMYAESVAETVQQAREELKIDRQLAKTELVWAELALQYEPFKGTGVPVVRHPDAVFEALDDHEVALQNTMGSRFMGFFETEIVSWKGKLSAVRATLDAWLEVQRAWCSLESIFLGSEDIRETLPEDAKRFDGVDTEFREQMIDAVTTPNPIEACMREGRLETFEKCLGALELCTRSLGEYLETKRRKFARFYFLSSADLVEILSKGRHPPAVQEHFIKLTDNMAAIQWRVGDDGGPAPTALAMRSAEGEVVQLRAPLSCEGLQAEEWLAKLVAHAQASLREQLKACIDAFGDTPREKWLYEHCAQLSVVASQVWWTADVGSAFDRLEQGNEGALKEYLGAAQAAMGALNAAIGRSDLSRNDRTKVITLITIEVHARDVVRRLVDGRADSSSAFAWQSQLKYRWDEERGDCLVNIADAELGYSYEYVGNPGRLVITPLTDRCYITLTQALRLVLGGAPAGPAGTGKTETVKDLGRGLAIWVIVQNCSDQMTSRVTSALFSGLAQTGAWGCFDEFNRIPIEVLSVAAGQWAAILDAVRARRERFALDDEELRLVRTVGAFITMNPGYAGRTELPENLKALFRPCAMVVPDFSSIVEISLAAEGFEEAPLLSQKFVELFRLSRELLSKQQHYDWGLRAMKGILRIAGGLKREDSDKSEAQVLMRALRDVNLPKLVLADHAVFVGLVEDLFPRVEAPPRDSAEVRQAVRTLLAEPSSQLQPEEAFVRKCVSLDEILGVRHSVFVLGPAGSGKSVVWRTLNHAYSHLAALSTATASAGAALVSTVNPKAVSSDELFGYMHPTTREPMDGIVARLMREYAHLDSPVAKWIVLDGDIDAGWIESMNSVMDDNKVLTLVSNERIPLTPSMRLIFEISHLRNASPATVSRAGVLFLNESDIGWRPYVMSWIEARVPKHPPAVLEQLFEQFAVPALEHVRREGWQHVTPLTEIAVVQSLCTLLQGLLERGVREGAHASAPDRELYEAHFQFATVWAVGGALASDKGADHRRAFSDWWQAELDKAASVHFPEADGLVFDYHVDVAQRRFVHWRELVGAYTHVPSAPFASVLVPTVDTTRLAFLAETLLPQRKPMMLVGGAGVAKSTILGEVLRALPDDCLSFTLNFNAHTDAPTLQPTLEQPLEKKTGSIYAPPGTKRLIYFIDDFNMPAPDKYGTQSAIELLRQQLDYGGFYDLRSHKLKHVHNTHVLAAMNPAAGSFHVADRMQRHFATFGCPFPEGGSVSALYRAVLGGHLAAFPVEIGRLAEPVVTAALALHREMVEGFLPTAANFHYQWSLRELSRVFEGLCLSAPDYFSSAVQLARLWLHESRRVYGDRLSTEQDRSRFADVLTRVAKSFFEEFAQDELLREPLIFASFAVASGGADEGGLARAYLPVAEYEKLRKLLEAQLRVHNETLPRMELVLFEDAMEHVCRISRILDRPRGNALLVGVGGSGKQSLTRLAGFIGGFELAQIALTPAYGLADFRADLLALYARTGLKGESVLWLLTDRQVVDERMLMYLNDCLCTGYTPELYQQEDRDAIVNAVRNEVKAAGLLDSRQNCWDFFIERVRANLHLVLCFSPIGDALRLRCRKFPALTACCAIDVFRPWPPDALISVASRHLAGVELGSDEMRENLAHHMAYVHECVTAQAAAFLAQERRHAYTTPKSFLELIELYKAQLGRARGSANEQIDRLDLGLVKLRESAAQVAEMQARLREEQVVVESKKVETEGLLEQVGHESQVADEQAQLAEAEEREVAKVQNEVAAFEAQCAADLAAAEPALKKAEEALNVLDKKALTELKSLPNPPRDVLGVCQAVLYMTAKPKTNLRKLDISWNAIKKGMGSVDSYLAMLQSFDRDNFPLENKEMVRRYTGPPDRPEPSFNGESMKSKSVAAAGLCEWVVNMCIYHDMYLEIEPKRQMLKEAQDKLDDANRKLGAVRAQVSSLEERKARLQDALVGATEEKNRLLETAQRTQKRLSLAERLVNGLKDENERWGALVELLKERKALLVGDVMVASSFIAYIGPFDEAFRRNLVHNMWIPDVLGRDIPLSSPAEGTAYDPVAILADDAQVAAWRSEGLPSDRLSVENGAIISSCARWPLIVDPQLQGAAWIRRHEEAAGLAVTQPTSRNCLERVRRAMEDGTPVLLENIPESLDPILEPVLARATLYKGRKLVIMLGDREVEVMTVGARARAQAAAAAAAAADAEADGAAGISVGVDARAPTPGTPGTPGGGGALLGLGAAASPDAPLFRLYLQTKLPNPHYSPEIQAQTTLVNFSVTAAGLEDQLLAVVSNFERSELEEQRASLLEQQNLFTIKLKELEDDLLYRLANAEGDVLADEVLIGSLEATKVTVRDVESKVLEMRHASAQIDRARETFRPVAARGSLIYFLIDGLNVIDSMYQYSLGAYMAVFYQALLLGDSAAPDGLDGLGGGGGAGGGGSAGADGGAAAAAGAPAAAAAGGGGAAGGYDGPGAERAPVVLTPTSHAPPPAEQLPARVAQLLEGVTFHSHAHVTRGLFERHRLIFATKLALDVLSERGELQPDDVELLVRPPRITDRVNTVGDWLSPGAWHALCGMVDAKPDVFGALPTEMEASWKRWKEWCDTEVPEQEPLPQEWKRLSAFYRLVLMRALRPDRLVPATEAWVREVLGAKYAAALPLELERAFADASPAVPIFFLLSAGVDPTAAVQALGRRRGFRREDGRFVTVALGQGQEPVAEKALDRTCAEGGWVVLQNIELVPAWLPRLERRLEALADGSVHPDFRAVLTAMPGGAVPVGLLQSSIKLSNEPPAGLRANMVRAYATFGEGVWEGSSRQPELKAIVFALCFFHSVVCERRRFGPIGWNRAYPFSLDDLSVCITVASSYLEGAVGPRLPWEDLRYICGEIMYGGHITDAWDRRLCSTYLAAFLRDELLESMPLAGKLEVPSASLSHRGYVEYISAQLEAAESAAAYGLHPNSEILVMSARANALFGAIAELQPRASAAGGGVGVAEKAKRTLDDILERLPEPFAVFELEERLSAEQRASPFVNVFAQECGRMNALLAEMRRTLLELDSGLKGDLSITESMEALMRQLYDNATPPSWEAVAWPSLRTLGAWFANLQARYRQLSDWLAELQVPRVTWLPGLFNPQAFLTAVMQVTARRTEWPLDRLAIVADVTKKAAEEIDGPTRDGAFVHGLFLQGARWDVSAGVLEEATLKDIHPPMPVVLIRAAEREKSEPRDLYVCPVYQTQSRGSTFVFTAGLRTKVPPAKWVMAGVAMLMDVSTAE